MLREEDQTTRKLKQQFFFVFTKFNKRVIKFSILLRAIDKGSPASMETSISVPCDAMRSVLVIITFRRYPKELIFRLTIFRQVPNDIDGCVELFFSWHFHLIHSSYQRKNKEKEGGEGEQKH